MDSYRSLRDFGGAAADVQAGNKVTTASIHPRCCCCCWVLDMGIMDETVEAFHEGFLPNVLAHRTIKSRRLCNGQSVLGVAPFCIVAHRTVKSSYHLRMHPADHSGVHPAVLPRQQLHDAKHVARSEVAAPLSRVTASRGECHFVTVSGSSDTWNVNLVFRVHGDPHAERGASGGHSRR